MESVGINRKHVLADPEEGGRRPRPSPSWIRSDLRLSQFYTESDQEGSLEVDREGLETARDGTELET